MPAGAARLSAINEIAQKERQRRKVDERGGSAPL
jgi:hypothetical protein